VKKLLYILFLIIVACKPTQTNNSTSEVSQKEYSGPKIVFFFFEASKNANNSIQIVLQEQKLVEGKLKGFFYKEIPSNEFKKTNLLVTFKSNTDDKIQLQIVNPLNEEVEYINEEGQLEKKTIYHEKKEFVVRIPYNNPINSIKFEQLTEINQKLSPLFINQIDL